MNTSESTEQQEFHEGSDDDAPNQDAGASAAAKAVAFNLQNDEKKQQQKITPIPLQNYDGSKLKNKAGYPLWQSRIKYKLSTNGFWSDNAPVNNSNPESYLYSSIDESILDILVAEFGIEIEATDIWRHCKNKFGSTGVGGQMEAFNNLAGIVWPTNSSVSDVISARRSFQKRWIKMD